MRSLHLLAAETKSEGSHKGNELFRAQFALGQALHNETAIVGLSLVLDSITFWSDIFSAHVENHGRATAVLDGSVATELDQIGRAQQFRDMIASVLDLLDLLHSEVELGALCNSKLVLKGKRTRCTSIVARNYD